MKPFWHIAPLLAAALLFAAACEKEQEQQTVTLQPQLSLVQIQSNAVEIPVDGKVEIIFTVEDKKFSFDPENDVALSPAPEAFSLTEVRQNGEGRYVAVLSDSGLTPVHSCHTSNIARHH